MQREAKRVLGRKSNHDLKARGGILEAEMKVAIGNNSREITLKLVRGAYAIDRMRNEVNIMVTLMFDLLHDELSQAINVTACEGNLVQNSRLSGGYRFEFEGRKCVWIVFRSDSASRIEIECQFYGTDGNRTVVYSTKLKRMNFGPRNVQAVWEELHVLREGVMSLVPQKDLDHYLAAADVSWPS